MFKLFDENGNCILNESYNEIKKLNALLDLANIPHTFERLLDGWQVCYISDELVPNVISDAIEHCGSYGHEEDLLEIMGLLTPESCDCVKGYMTAQEVFELWSSHYIKAKQDSKGE